MNYILFDGSARDSLLPLTRTRPVAGVRVGALTLLEKWERFLDAACSCLTPPYLREQFPFVPAAENILINGAVLPEKSLVEKISQLRQGQALMREGTLLAIRLSREKTLRFAEKEEGSGVGAWDPGPDSLEWESSLTQLINPEDIFQMNAAAIAADMALLTAGRASAPASGTNVVLGDDLFIEEGVDMECATINTRTGPVYIGKGAVIMEGSHLRGPLALCEGAVVKMGARLYGPVTIGPRSVVGGEIKQSVIFGNTNKSHDGYLGNSVIGEWCNFGAGTSCSNMKNNYKPVKLWSYVAGDMRDTGLSYCGLIMGDFSRTGINTMFNTGTTVGVNVHVFGSALPPAFVPDFSWGIGDALRPYLLERALEAVPRIMEQKGGSFTGTEGRMLSSVFDETARYREGHEVRDPVEDSNLVEAPHERKQAKQNNR